MIIIVEYVNNIFMTYRFMKRIACLFFVIMKKNPVAFPLYLYLKDLNAFVIIDSDGRISKKYFKILGRLDQIPSEIEKKNRKLNNS